MRGPGIATRNASTDRTAARDAAHPGKRADRHAHLARSTDDPSHETTGRRHGAKARTHKSRRYTGA